MMMIYHPLKFILWFIISIYIINYSSIAVAMGDIAVIDGVMVNESALFLEAAKDNAMTKGGQEGARRILKRIAVFMTERGMRNALKEYDSTLWIRKIEPYDERIHSNAYSAKLRIYFDLEQVKRALIKSGIQVRVVWSPKILIVPLLHNIVDEELQKNWQNGWENLPKEIGLLQYQIIRNDLGDIALLTQDKAALLKKYDSKDLIAVYLQNIEDARVKVICQGAVGANIIKAELIYNNTNYDAIAFDIANRIDASYKGLYDVWNNDRDWRKNYECN